VKHVLHAVRRTFAAAHPLRPLAWVALAVLLVAAWPWAPSAAAQSSASADAVWVVPIETEISAATAAFVRARIDRANRERPLAVVLYLDTPGGQVAAMQRIVDDVLSRAEVPTLAVVRNAFSAGALIAMAAEQVAMLPGSAIGAATPIVATPLGVAPVDEKFNSALRGEFRAVAEARGRDPRIAEAMVDARIEIPGLATSEELVTLTAAEAVEYGIADVEARTLQDALERFGYGGARVERLEPNVAERVGTFLANPLIVALLLVLGIGGLVLEFFSPGFGIPGGIGILALALLGLTAVVATPAGPLDLLLIVVGIVLLAIEAIVLPGFGVAGVLGLGVLGYAIFRVFQESWLTVLGGSTVFGGLLLAALLWVLPYSRVASRFRLATRIGRTPDASPVTPGRADERSELLEAIGTALTDLRPAGLARFGDERVDVVTLGDYVAVGTAVRVVRVEGSRVTVRAIEPSVSPAPATDAGR
jgi:membrane-bound serine protease (ClpP class)